MAADTRILEALPLQVLPGQTAAFEAAFATASPIVERAAGYVKHELRRSLEFENRYLLLITWATLEDHMETFRSSDDYKAWAAALHPFYEVMPTMEHFEGVYPA